MDVPQLRLLTSVAEIISDGGSTRDAKFQALGFGFQSSGVREPSKLPRKLWPILSDTKIQGKHYYDEAMSKGKLQSS